MGIKEAVYARLHRTQVVRDVLPTTRVERAARPQFEMELADLAAGGANYIARLATVPGRTIIDPSPALVENPALLEQVAGFAEAGLLFFQAAPAMVDRNLTERRAHGASGSVSRVMIDEGRLLLETQRIILQFDPALSEADRTDFLERHNLVMLNRLGFLDGGQRVALLQGNALEVSLELMDYDEVVFAEPDFVEHVGQRNWPNDAALDRQWHLRNGGSGGATAGADISAEAAWDVTTGEGVRIAIIDNGFDTAHRDLRFGPLSGWFRQTSDFQDAEFVAGVAGMPNGDHGTACAGMAAAIGNNGIGGCGVAWGAECSMIACIADQIGTQSTLARALAQAVSPNLETQDNLPAGSGADIVCCSLGPSRGAAWELSQTLKSAIEFVGSFGRGGRGTPLFWACTNGNHPISADKICSHPDVVAVGRSSRNDLDDGSGFGAKLEFLAPGVKVYLPSRGNAHKATTGTSFAAPCAAGVGALVVAANPALSASDVRRILRDTCDKVGDVPYAGGRHDRFGHGRVNAEAAVRAAG